VVLPDSHEIPRAPCYLGTRQGSHASFAYRTVTVCGTPFQAIRLPAWFVTSRQHGSTGQARPATPDTQRPPAITRTRFGLFPFRSPLLRESLLLSLPAGTEMFHFPALPHTALCIQAAATAHDGRRVSPFGNPRITAWLPAPRGISQAPASFIGSWCQGIHRVPLKTWHNKKTLQTTTIPAIAETGDARVHCAVLKIRAATAPVQRVRAGRGRSCPRPVLTHPFPQDPTACPPRTSPALPVPQPRAGSVLTGEQAPEPG
jgi:hypothetical protein